MYYQSQIKANKNYRQKHPEWSRYVSYRGTAKMFIRKHATKEDLQQLIQMAQKRLNELSNKA